MPTDVPGPGELPKRSELWFDDGNLVLETENTQFRVHRGIICASSTVFKSMFNIPQLTPGDEVVDGCPVIRLSDSAVELQHVLKAIYDRGYKLSGDSDFTQVSAFLRLGKKYGIDALYKEAMEQLPPTTLEEWDKMFDRTSDSDSEISEEEEDAFLAICVQTVNLALETDTSLLIPASLSLALSVSSLSKIARGSSTGSCPYFLRHEGLIMACSGYERLRKTVHPCFKPKCGKSSCEDGVRREFLENENFNVLVPLNDFIPDLCTQCKLGARNYWTEKRKKVWEELPSYFCLPSWEVIIEKPGSLEWT